MRIFATHLKRERRPRHLDMNSVYNWASNAKMNVVVHISRDALQYFGETDRQTCVLNFPLQPISRYMPDIAQSDSSGECKSNWPVAFLVRNTLSKILPSSANLYVNRRKFVTLDMVDTCMKLVESCFEAVRERDGHTIHVTHNHIHNAKVPLDVAHYVDLDPAYRNQTIQGVPVLDHVEGNYPIVVIAQMQKESVLESIRKLGIQNRIITI